MSNDWAWLDTSQDANQSFFDPVALGNLQRDVLLGNPTTRRHTRRARPLASATPEAYCLICSDIFSTYVPKFFNSTPWLLRNFPIPSTCAIHSKVPVNRIRSNPDILPAIRFLCRSTKRSMTPP